MTFSAIDMIRCSYNSGEITVTRISVSRGNNNYDIGYYVNNGTIHISKTSYLAGADVLFIMTKP